jgi:hypothetical protein
MFIQDYHLGAFQVLGFFGGLEGHHHTGGSSVEMIGTPKEQY